MNTDIAIVGAGIVGLAVADALLAREPGVEVTVFEKEPDLALHASGRNSGVIHAGFYYAPNSLKARLTRRGNVLLHSFIDSQGLAIRRCGKVVVASSREQLPVLDLLYERGMANGVPLQRITAAQLAGIEPLASTVEQALWSPSTSVADPRQVTRALADRVIQRGGRVMLNTTVKAARQGTLETSQGSVKCGHLVNAAGLYADRVGDWFGVADDYRMLPFKGLYWYGSWDKGRNQPLPAVAGLSRHVYPVPDPANPFLGVHLTVTVDGRVKVGPTAIPALWREDYGGLRGHNARETLEILDTYPAFLSSPHHNATQLIRSEVPKYLHRVLVNQARTLVPSIRPEDFTIKGTPGVRAQMFHLPTRRLEMDFVVRHTPDSTHILNAVSPAWTSALAVGEHLAPQIMSHVG